MTFQHMIIKQGVDEGITKAEAVALFNEMVAS